MRRSLEGCRAKIERADKDIEYLCAAILSFIKRNVYSAVLQYHPDAHQWITDVRFENPPICWSVMCGGVLYHLRSALDHLACVLSKSGDCSGTEFPIYEFPPARQRDMGERYCRKVKLFMPQAQAFIEGMQPYHRGEDARGSPLFRLHWMNNRDKHQTLNVLVSAIGTGHGRVTRDLGHGQRTESDIWFPPAMWEMFRTEQGATRFSIAGRAQDPPIMEMYAQFSPEVMFDEPVAGIHEPVVPCLTQLSREVSRIITEGSRFLPP